MRRRPFLPLFQRYARANKPEKTEDIRVSQLFNQSAKFTHDPEHDIEDTLIHNKARRSIIVAESEAYYICCTDTGRIGDMTNETIADWLETKHRGKSVGGEMKIHKDDFNTVLNMNVQQVNKVLHRVVDVGGEPTDEDSDEETLQNSFEDINNIDYSARSSVMISSVERISDRKICISLKNIQSMWTSFSSEEHKN